VVLGAGAVLAGMGTNERDFDPGEEYPMNAQTPASPPRHVLLVANETATADTLRRTIRSVVGSAEDPEVLVVAPTERVHRCVDQLLQAGFIAEGMAADADPLRAIEDVLRSSPAEALIVSIDSEGESSWLAGDIIDETGERFGLPVTHLVVDAAGAREAGASNDPVAA
jgi:hypothetical protein